MGVFIKVAIIDILDLLLTNNVSFQVVSIDETATVGGEERCGRDKVVVVFAMIDSRFSFGSTVD